MGWNYRKSVNLGGGFRLNFSKSGVGVSGGVKGFRVSSGPRGKRLFASIPGTGLYYTKSLGGGKSSSRKKSSSAVRPVTNNTGNIYQYSQTVTNEYTGETRELRARTQFELNQMVQTEQARQAVNEKRQKILETAQNREQQVLSMNQQLEAVKNALGQLINHTLTVNDRIDWEANMITKEYPPLQLVEQAPQRQGFKLPFFKSLFMNEKKFELPDNENDLIRQYEARRNAAISDYIRKKSEYDKEKNRRNGEMAYLKKRFEESDKEAVERYISIVLTKSQYPTDFEHDFQVKYDRDKKIAIIDFLFQSIDAFPVIREYIYNQKKDSIEEIMMDKDEAINFYSGILYSVGIRTIHEVFESVYTDAVDTVCFNGYIEDEGGSLCAFAMKANREGFEKMDLTQPISMLISGVESRTVGDFTKADFVTPYE